MMLRTPSGFRKTIEILVHIFFWVDLYLSFHRPDYLKNNQGLGVHKLACTKTKGHLPPQLTDVHDTGVSEKREDTLIDDVVKSTVNYLLSRVDCEESENGSSLVSRGIKRKPKASEVRKTHPAVFKAKIIHQCQPGVSQYEIAAKYGISQSLVSKWIEQKDSIITAATSRHKKLFAKQRPSRKYLELYRVLLERLKEARAKGLQVNFNWLWSKARTIYREQTNDDNKIENKHVITTILRRYNVGMR